MNNSPLVSTVILNWNGKKYLADCLTSLINQKYSNLEIILVDNGSRDDSVEFVKKRFLQVKIIENEENLGFAGGNNVGIKSAEGKYIFLLNNDTKTDENCLKNLVEAAESNEKIGMAAPKIVSFENPSVIDSAGVNIYFDGMSRGKGRKETDKGQYNEVQEILLPSGCAALYRKKMLDEIGLFDENFFAYCEDTDLGLRARLAGWKAVLSPQAVVYHHYSGTVGRYSEIKAFLVERNHFWVVFKNFPLSLIFALPFYTVKRYLFLTFGIATNRGPAAKSQFSKFKLFFILIKAYLAVLKGLIPVLKERKSIRKNKKLTDKEFFDLMRKNLLKISEISLND